MDPQPNLAIVATIQQAITSLLTTSEPAFLQFGYSLFVSFATIVSQRREDLKVHLGEPRCVPARICSCPW